MDGITVLNTEQILISGGPGIVGLGVFVLALSVLILYFFSISISKIYKCMFMFLFIVYLGTTVFTFMHVTPEYKTAYQVIVNDKVNFNEFQTQYQVLKQEGLIYTIIKKD